VSFGRFETAAAVAVLTVEFGFGTVILKSGFDGVKCIAMVVT
jgi:hypothetical protein